MLLFGEICKRIRQLSLLEARTSMWHHVAGEQKSAEAVVAYFATSEDAKGQTVFLQGPSRHDLDPSSTHRNQFAEFR